MVVKQGEMTSCFMFQGEAQNFSLPLKRNSLKGKIVLEVLKTRQEPGYFWEGTSLPHHPSEAREICAASPALLT